MNRFLVVDTTAEHSFVALFAEEKLDMLLPLSGREVSKTLLQAIKSLRISDIEAIGVAIGPGSFTGTRIGVMTATVLSYTLQIPLLTYHALVPFSRKGGVTLCKQGRGVWLYEELSDHLTQIDPSTLTQETRPLYVPRSQLDALSLEFHPLILRGVPFSQERLSHFLSHKNKAKAYTDPKQVKVLYTKPQFWVDCF